MDGSDIKLYLSWKPDRVDKRLQEYLRQGDEGRARQLSQTLSSVERLWKGFVIDQSRGELISLIGDGVSRACIPADALEGVEKIRAQASRFLQSPLSVGVGMSMVDADLALKVAVRRGGDQIQLWDRETMIPELEQADQQLQKADGPQAEETPSNKGNAGGGFTPRDESGEKPVPPRAEGSEHSQGEVAQAAAQEFSGPEATHGAGGGDPEQAFKGHADAQEDDDQREQDQAQGQDGVRAKVVEILKQVKEAAPQLEQLKQASPDLYAVLMDMTQALILTARAMVEGDGGQPQGDQQQVQKTELAKTWPRPITPEDQGGVDPLRDPRAQKDAQTLAEITQDTVTEGGPRVKEVGAKIIAKPEGAQISGNKRAINSEKRYPKTDEGWAVSPAANERVVEATRANDTLERQQREASGGFTYAGQEPSGTWVRGGLYRPHGADKMSMWPAGHDPDREDSRFWISAAEQAQARAFPIPQHDPSTGPDPWGRVHHYDWQLAQRHHDTPPTWGIHSTLRRRDGDNPYAMGPGGSQTGPFYEINPETGLLNEVSTAETSEDPELQHQRQHLNQFLASLGGLHKTEHEAGFRNKVTGDIVPTGSHHDVDRLPGGEFNPEDFEEGFIRKSDGEFVTRDELQKGKLPMPENAPKHKFKHPVGASKDGKVKIRHQDGTSSWVSVRAGQVLSNDGHPISSRNPDGR